MIDEDHRHCMGEDEDEEMDCEQEQPQPQAQATMTITLEIGGETRQKTVPINGTVRTLFELGFFDEMPRNGLMVNGGPAGDDDTLADGDRVAQMPKSGKQG